MPPTAANRWPILVTIAPSATKDDALAEATEAEFQDKWKQTITPDSREIVIAIRGEAMSVYLRNCKPKPDKRISGITVQENCATDSGWRQVRNGAFVIFHNIVRIADWRSMALKFRVREQNPHILPFSTVKTCTQPLTMSKLSRIARMHVRYDTHIRRAAWTCHAALHSDPAGDSYWQRTGRLVHMCQGHFPQRWQASVALACMHDLVPYLVFANRCTTFGDLFSLSANEADQVQKKNCPTYCCCFYQGAAHNELIRISF